jgi:hypothetical protein
MRPTPLTPIRTAIRAVMTAAVSIAFVGCASSGAGSSGKAASGHTASAAEIAAREQTADQQVQHVLNRLAFGPRPGDVASVRALGVDAWIARQLEPGKIDDSKTTTFLAQFTTLNKTGEQLLTDYPPPGVQLAQAARQKRWQDHGGRLDEAAAAGASVVPVPG